MVGRLSKELKNIIQKCIDMFDILRYTKMSSSSNQVVLLRHGESEFNKNNWFCGWHDSPLSEKGRQQASEIAAANLIKHNMTKFDCIYTSRLTRAKDTVRIIMKALDHSDIPIYSDWRLNERHYGDLTGYNKREMADKYGETQVQLWRRKFDVVPPCISCENPYYLGIVNNVNFCDIPVDQFPASESMEMALKRTINLWNSEILPKVLKGERVLIISHGTTTRSLVKHIEGISDKDIDSFNIPNSVPCVYEFDLNTGERIGGIKYLADEEYVTKEANKVALIGEKNVEQVGVN